MSAEPRPRTPRSAGAVAVVTGGGSGIGRASAIAFAEAGASVVVADVDEASGRETVELLDGAATFVKVDVTSEADVSRMFAHCLEHHGSVDAVHNNAGVPSPRYAVHELPAEEWTRILDVNLRGAWTVMKHALLQMRPRRRGAIVSTCSIGATSAIPERGAYCASKAGLLQLTRVAAAENAALGIRVNAVAPGRIETPMSAGFIAQTGLPPGPPPTHRMGTAAEVAAAAVWLCSDAASYVNGACLAIDGGWSTVAAGSAPGLQGGEPS